VGPTTTGVLAAGVFTYVFLSVAARDLGPSAFGPVSTLWAMAFLVGPGLFLAVQQELGRIASRHREDRAAGGLLLQAGTVTGGIVVVALAITFLARHWILSDLLSGQTALLWCFCGAILTWAVSYLFRGLYSGLADFTGFSLVVAGEAAARLPVAFATRLLGASPSTSYGLGLALAPLVAVAVVVPLRRRTRIHAGAWAAWPDMLGAFGWLTAGSLLAQALANAGPITVQALARPDQKVETGRFLSALVIARVSFYLFQAVQAALIPNLAALHGAGNHTALRAAVRRMLRVGAAFVVVCTAGAALLGPFVVRLLFGHGFTVTAGQMAALTAASTIYVLAALLNSVTIASASHRPGAIAWALGCAAFGAGLFAFHDLLHRVEAAFLLGSLTACATLLLMIWWLTSSRPDARTDALPDNDSGGVRS